MGQLRFHQAGRLIPLATNKGTDGQAAESATYATLYIMRPDEGTRNMTQILYINDELIDKKMKPGEYAVYYFTPGVVKIGKVHAKNKRKVSTGAAILMGGVVGLAATSGKTIGQSERLFYTDLEAGKSYYVSSVITKDKKIRFNNMPDTEGKALLPSLKLIEN